MSWSRRPFSARALLVVVDDIVLVVIIVVFIVVAGLVLFFALFFLILEIVLFVRDLELDRGVARYAQQRAAFRARQLIADIDVKLVDVNGRITLGTNRGHAGCSLGGVGPVVPNYNENLIKSATNRAHLRTRYDFNIFNTQDRGGGHRNQFHSRSLQGGARRRRPSRHDDEIGGAAAGVGPGRL